MDGYGHHLDPVPLSVSRLLTMIRKTAGWQAAWAEQVSLDAWQIFVPLNSDGTIRRVTPEFALTLAEEASNKVFLVALAALLRGGAVQVDTRGGMIRRMFQAIKHRTHDIIRGKEK